MGFLLTKNKDFIHLSITGMSVLSLGSVEKRAFKDNKNVDRMVHSLESFNFLKADKTNYLSFSGSKVGSNIVSIE